MMTGDGLLVRLYLNTPHVLPQQAQRIAQLSQQYGNGHIDITARGSIQLRGVSEQNYAQLLPQLQALNISREERSPRPDTAPNLTLGWHNNTLTLGMACGRLTAAALAWVALIAPQHIIVTTQRALIINNVPQPTLAQAIDHGFIVHDTDPRRFIEACTGAPACSSALADTRALAQHMAQALPQLAQVVHISGCAKGCAYRQAAPCTIVAQQNGYAVVYNGKAQDAPQYSGLQWPQLISLVTPQ